MAASWSIRDQDKSERREPQRLCDLDRWLGAFPLWFSVSEDLARSRVVTGPDESLEMSWSKCRARPSEEKKKIK
jgi:hypothetical protein